MVAMLFQHVAFAMPCCIDMSGLPTKSAYAPSVDESIHQADEHMSCHTQMEADSTDRDASNIVDNEPEHKCPMMAVAPSVSAVTLFDAPNKLPLVQVAPVLHATLSPWAANAPVSRLERPPRV